MNSGKVSYEELEEKVKLLEERISALIRHDPITGLHNKKAFLERLEEGLIHAARYGNTKSIVLVRLNRFDDVRQQFGDGIAEMFIKRIARKMRTLFRESDYLSRLSGSEFGVILGNPHKGTPEAVRRKIQETLTPPFEIGGARIEFVSVSVGIAVFPRDGEDIDTLLRHAADAADGSEI
jgi:diguanylate cyclase (GGDEF)-like protein